MNLGIYGGLPTRREYKKYDPFAPPLLPSHLDDEFDTPTNGSANGAGFVPPGWTSVGSQAALDMQSKGTGLFVRSPTTTALTSVMFERPLPPGPFIVATHVHNLRQSNWHPVGIYLRSSVSGRRICLNLFQHDNIGGWEKRIQLEKFSALDTRDTVSTIALWWWQSAFLSFFYDGTTLALRVSPDGHFWTWAFSEPMTTYFTGGDLPDRFGMQMRSERVDDNGYGVWRFIRYFSDISADVGRAEYTEG